MAKSRGQPKLLSASDGGKMNAAERKRLSRYSRGDGNSSKGVTKPGLKRSIKRGEAKIGAAERKAAQAEVLQPSEAGFLEAEGPLERTCRVRQSQLAAMVDEQTAAKAYEVQLPDLGPYRVAFTANGRRLLLGGRKGHVAVARWEGGFHVLSELQLRETVRDLTFLRDHTMFAVAQHKNLYIYDASGTELHCLRSHRPDVQRLAYLKYHWLLATVGSTGQLRYLDVSTGENVSDIRTRLGECDCMRASPYNAVVHLGHTNGTVTLWTPNMHEPVAKLLCHKGAVADLAIDRAGRYLATSGRDGTLKVWDVRTYRPLHSYRTPRPVTSMDVSDRGLLAAACGAAVQVFKDGLAARASAPYMTHRLPGREATVVRFCPYEDVLGVGHSRGYSSVLVPGAGEPNFDAFEANPFETRTQRREAEVVALLEKLPAETITLDPQQLGKVDRNQGERQREIQAANAARIADIKANRKAKRKTRGRSKASRRAAKKEGNIIDEKRQRRKAQLEAQEQAKSKKRTNRASGGAGAPPKPYDPLDRFVAPPAPAPG